MLQRYMKLFASEDVSVEWRMCDYAGGPDFPGQRISARPWVKIGNGFWRHTEETSAHRFAFWLGCCDTVEDVRELLHGCS